MIKKALLSGLAALGLLAAPVAGAVASAVPEAPLEAPTPRPFRQVDGARSTRYYVPKGVRKRERSRLSLFCKEVFGGLPNRRSVGKAYLRGAGRGVESFASRGSQILVRHICDESGRLTGARQTTRRAAERSARARAMGFAS